MEQNSVIAAPSRWQNSLRWVLVALLQLPMMLVIAGQYTPWIPGQVAAGLDPSYVFAMNQALQQGLEFGRQIVFSFGPFSALHTQVVLAPSDHLMLMLGSLLALTYWLLNLRLTMSRPLLWQVLWWLALASLISNRDVLFYSYQLLLLLLLYQALDRSRPLPLRRRDSYLLMPGFFMLGLFPLLKVSQFSSSISLLLLTSLWLIWQREWRWLLQLVAPFLSGLVLFWLLAGQALENLGLYLWRTPWLVSGFSEAMSLQGRWLEIFLYVTAVALLLKAWFSTTTAAQKPRWWLLAALMLLMFFIAKGAFVRHDAHALMAGQGLVMLLLLLPFPERQRVAASTLLLVFLCWFLIDAHHLKSSTESIYGRWQSNHEKLIYGLRYRLQNPNWLAQRQLEAVKKIRQINPFPVLPGTVDIYPWDQSSLIASGNPWRPRPLIQSYSVYNPALAQLNREFLGSDQAAEYLLFNVKNIDKRFPSLADGASWPLILQHYQVLETVGEYLLLQRVVNSESVQEPALISRTQLALDQWHEVPLTEALQWVKLELKPSLVGRLVGFLYKPEPLQIEVKLANQQNKRYRLISGMAEAGFLLSPLVSNQQEFQRLYADYDLQVENRVVAFKVIADAAAWQWQRNFDFQSFAVKIPAALQIDSRSLMQTQLSADNLKIQPAKKCVGFVDRVNGKKPAKAPQKTGATLAVHGWFALDTKTAELPDEVVLVLQSQSTGLQYYSTRRYQREGLGNYFKNPAMSQAAFDSLIDVTNWPDKDAYLSVALRQGSVLTPCSQYKIPLKINQLTHE